MTNSFAKIIEAISWTLAHSLWLGLVLTLIAGTTVLLTRNTSARLRYNLLALQLLGFIASVIITFFIQLNYSDDHSLIQYSPTGSENLVITLQEEL